MNNIKFSRFVFQDWSSNRKNPKGRLILTAFRIANYASTKTGWRRLSFYPYLIFYRVFVEWILGVELPWKTRIGPGLKLHHGQSLVVNDNVIIGSNCILRHCTTIGVSHTSESFSGDVPVIGDGVDIGANVVIIGRVIVGSNSIIGAGSVVIRDVAEGSVVVGNPGRVIKVLN